MNEYPAGAGYDDPRWRLGTADGETGLSRLTSYPHSASVRKIVSVKARRLDSDALPGERRQSRLPDFTSKTGETLRCARSGGPGPSAEPVVTGDRREPNERRCGGGERSPSCGWRGVVREMNAVEGSGHE